MGKTGLGGARKAISRGRQAELIKKYGENATPVLNPSARKHVLEKLGIIEKEAPAVSSDDLENFFAETQERLKKGIEKTPLK